MRLRWRRPAGGGETGLTLIELAVAVLVLSIGAIAATRASDQAQSALGGMQARVLARIVAQNRAEELRLFGAAAPLPEVVEMAGQAFEVTVESEDTAGGFVQATIVVGSQTGPGARLVAYVPLIGPGATP